MNRAALIYTALMFGAFCWVVQALSRWLLYRGLRLRYPYLWEMFGGRFMWSGFFILDWGIIEILMKRTYAGADSSAATKFCDQYRIPIIISYFGLILAFATLFIAGFGLRMIGVVQ